MSWDAFMVAYALFVAPWALLCVLELARRAVAVRRRV